MNQTAFQSTATKLCLYIPFLCSCDLDRNSMTLTHKSNLGILKRYLHTKHEVTR